MSSLHKRIVRAAYEKPHLRPFLLPLLKKAFRFQSSDLQEALDKALANTGWRHYEKRGLLQVESFQVSTKPWGYVIQGTIGPGGLAFAKEDPRGFQQTAMEGLRLYSYKLPGTVSVEAKLRSGPEVVFVLSGKGV